MASVWKHSKDKPTKASVLKDGENRTVSARRKANREKPDRSDMQDFLPAKAVAAKKLRLWADITVLALIVLLAVGVFFGYRVLKKNATEIDTQTVWIEYRVRLDSVPEAMSLHTLQGQSICLASDGRDVGTVVQTEQDGSWVWLTVQTEVTHKEGNGYWLDSDRLIVGAAATFRLGDASTVGRIVSLRPLD